MNVSVCEYKVSDQSMKGGLAVNVFGGADGFWCGSAVVVVDTSSTVEFETYAGGYFRSHLVNACLYSSCACISLFYYFLCFYR